MERKIYTFVGEITAVTNLAVSRDVDKFFEEGVYESAKISRIPRCGVKVVESPGYFPCGSLLGQLRRSTTGAIRIKEALRLDSKTPFDLETKYLLDQGMLLGSKKRAEAAAHKGIVPGNANALRDKNPALSIHGRWQLSALWGVDNMYTRHQDDIQLVGSKFRTNEYVRSPEQVEFLSESDQSWLQKIFEHDLTIPEKKNSDETSLKELKDLLKGADNPTDKKKYKNLIADMESSAKVVKVSAANEANAFVERIMHVVGQYEVIRRGSVLDHRMKLEKATKLDLGFVLATLRYFSLNPSVGGHKRDCCGEIKAQYTVTTASFETGEVRELGVVNYGPMEFGFAEGSSELVDALAYFDEVAINFEEHGIDFTIAGIPD